MRSRVDLPQPDGPTMQTNSPGAIVRTHVVDRNDGRIRVAELLAQMIDFDGGPAPLDSHACPDFELVSPTCGAVTGTP